MVFRSHRLILAILIAVTAAGTAAQPTLGTGFVQAAPGATCQQTCTANSKTAAFLNNFYTDASTYLCAANVSGQAYIAGYQTTDPVCTTTYNNAVINATDFGCLCLTSQQTPGLEASTGTESCEQTCAQTLEGEVGTAVRTDAHTPLYACLPASEAGVHNRFGYADDQLLPALLSPTTAQLEAASGVEAVQSLACITAGAATQRPFSCFCTFEPQAATTTPATSSVSAAIATAGRRMLF